MRILIYFERRLLTKIMVFSVFELAYIGITYLIVSSMGYKNNSEVLRLWFVRLNFNYLSKDFGPYANDSRERQYGACNKYSVLYLSVLY